MACLSLSLDVAAKEPRVLACFRVTGGLRATATGSIVSLQDFHVRKRNGEKESGVVTPGESR
jgi:hypothetical protein